MNHNHNIPDLIINKSVRDMFDLSRFLYKGAAGQAADRVKRPIATGKLGYPMRDRLPLLQKIKEQLELELTRGHSLVTVEKNISCLSLFYRFVDDSNLPTGLRDLKKTYIAYSEHLLDRVQRLKSINMNTAYGEAAMLSNLFSRVLKLPEQQRIIIETRVKYISNKRVKATGRTAEKQNLQDTTVMGCYLCDLVNGLSIDAIYGQLPIEIKTRRANGNTKATLLDHNQGNNRTCKKVKLRDLKIQEECRKPVDEIKNPTRKVLIWLRLCAELLIFVAQTGCSVSQVVKLTRSHFKYKSSDESSFTVSVFKARRQGEQSFIIYKEYKKYLKAHIAFVEHFFPDSDKLFPFGESDSYIPVYSKYRIIKRVLKKDNIPWISPITLKNTRVNWLLRRSDDPEMTADMAQHTKEILHKDYEKPSQQRAINNITRFWDSFEPMKIGLVGVCDGKANSMEDKPKNVVSPNCKSQSGCLWCSSHQDIKSFDYVWSLSSMRHLKTIEAAQPIKRELPADLVVNRLTQKLDCFNAISDETCGWVEEASLRIQEGKYHPDWAAIIEFWE